MRDLNKEYKEMVLNETPDIWSRIEAGLDERQQAAAAPKRKTFKITRIMGYAGAAAAAVLCICLVIPVLRGGRNVATSAPDSASPRHIRSESAAAETAAPQAVADRADDDKDAVTAGANRNSSKQAMNSYTAVADNSEMAFELSSEDEAAGEDTTMEEAAEPAAEPALLPGEHLIRITLVKGAGLDSIRDLTDEFSLRLYEENDDTFLFAVPAGIDMKELTDRIMDNENIATSENIITTEGS